jgi:hypothetical protein
MGMDKYTIERTFELHTEFHARDQVGFSRDKIFRGIFENTLTRIHGYQKHELKSATKRGWVKRVDLNPDGSGIRTAYIWLLEEMPQRGAIKTFFDKIYRRCTGEYERYYGKE